MMVQQLPPGGAVSAWPRAAIHDTVAAIARQTPYRRDFTRSLLDRILEWIADAFSRLIHAVGGVPHSRFIATIAFTIVVVLIVARVFYSARLRSGDEAAGVPGGGRATSTSDPWRDAELLAAGGNYTGAAHALYRAALFMLAARGLVRLHESKTSGDYARELRRRGAPVASVFRRFGARYDRIIYGDGVCDSSQYAALLDDARAVALVRETGRAA